MQVTEASALEDTLARLRQRYALFFHLPEGFASTDQATVEVELSNQTRLRFQEAEIRYRRVYMAGNSSGDRTGPVITRVQEPANTNPEPVPSQDKPILKHRSIAVNDDSGPTINTIDDPDSGGSGQQNTSAATNAKQPPAQNTQPSTSTPSSSTQPKRGGWPRATPQDAPQQ